MNNSTRIFILFFFCTSALSVLSQEQIAPLDSTGIVRIVDKELEAKIGFKIIEQDYNQARIYVTADSLYFIESSIKDNPDSKRFKRFITRTLFDSIRTKVQYLLRVSEVALSEEGRFEFMTHMAIHSLFFYSPLSSFALLPSSFTGVALASTMGGVGSYIINMALASNSNMSYGTSQLGITGSQWGITNGLFVGGLIGNYQKKSDDIRILGLTGFIGGIAGTSLGVHIANKYNFTEGRAAAFSTFWRNSLLTCVGIGFTAEMNKWKAPQIFGTLLASNIISTAVAIPLSTISDFTLGDVRFLETAGYLGFLSGVGLNSMINTSANTDYAIATSAFIGGHIIGYLTTKNHDFTNSHGARVYLWSACGASIGALLGRIVDVDNPQGRNSGNMSFIPNYWAITSAVGGWAGYIIALSTYSDDAPPKTSFLENLMMSVNPLALISLPINPTTPIQIFQMSTTF